MKLLQAMFRRRAERGDVANPVAETPVAEPVADPAPPVEPQPVDAAVNPDIKDAEDMDPKTPTTPPTSPPPSPTPAPPAPTTPPAGPAGPTAATFMELSAVVPAKTPGRADFIVACLGESLTLSAAQTKLANHLIEHADKADARAADLGKVAGAAGPGGGAPPLGVSSPPARGGGRNGAAHANEKFGRTHEEKQRAQGPASQAFYDRVDAVATERKITRDAAIMAVQKENDGELLNNYLAECNPNRGKR